MNKNLTMLLGAAMLLTTGVTFASALKLADSGVYVNANIGYGKADYVADPGASSFKNKSMVWGAGIGYQFNTNWAVELGYMKLPTTKQKDNFEGVEDNTTVRNSMVDMLVKYAFPLNSKFDFGLLGGAGYTFTTQTDDLSGSFVSPIRYKSKENKIVPVVGLSLGYKVIPRVSLAARFMMTTKTGDLPANFMGTLGLSYLF